MSPAPPLLLSIAPVNTAAGKLYYDLEASLVIMEELQRRGTADSFEFQLLEEWNRDQPPRDEREKRLPHWQRSAKYDVDTIAARVRRAGVRIGSVHAPRDIGILLCSDREQDRARGQGMIHESLSFAAETGASVCVFHLWDTRSEEFDLGRLTDCLAVIAAGYPDVTAAVENVPTCRKGSTPLDLVRAFPRFTLDLQWAALFDGLKRYEPLRDRIANVHLRGRLDKGSWILPREPLGFEGALVLLLHEWHYRGPLTMEPDGLTTGDMDTLRAGMERLKTITAEGHEFGTSRPSPFSP